VAKVTRVAEVGEVKEVQEVKNGDARRNRAGYFFASGEIVDLQGGCELIFYFRFPLDG
jgi:hypothetical protein